MSVTPLCMSAVLSAQSSVAGSSIAGDDAQSSVAGSTVGREMTRRAVLPAHSRSREETRRAVLPAHSRDRR